MKPSGAHGTTLPPTPTAPASYPASSSRAHAGSGSQSSSRNATTEAVAAWTPVFRAAARPRLTSCLITVARCSRPTSLVLSVEPSSTTMTCSSTSFWSARARRHRSTPAAPLSEQITTLRSADM